MCMQTVRGASLLLYLENGYYADTPKFMQKLAAIALGNSTLQSKSLGAFLEIYPRNTQTSGKIGILLSPGVETTVTLSSTERTRLQAPYGFCTTQQLYNNTNNYTLDGCIYNCYLLKVRCVTDTFEFSNSLIVLTKTFNVDVLPYSALYSITKRA